MGLIMIDLVGWLGSAMLAACGVPLLYTCIKERSIAKNISMAFLQLWLWGEVFVIVYAAMQSVELMPILFNCVSNIVCIFGILWIRWRV